MFIVILYTIAKLSDKVLSTDKWIRKIMYAWYCFIWLQNQSDVTCKKMDGIGIIMLSKISNVPERQILCIFSPKSLGYFFKDMKWKRALWKSTTIRGGEGKKRTKGYEGRKYDQDTSSTHVETS